MSSAVVVKRHQAASAGLRREAVIDLYAKGHGTHEIADLLGMDTAAVGWVLRVAGAL